MINKTTLLMLCLVLATLACKSTKHSVRELPKWVIQYDSGEKRCGVGISLPHIKGISHQRVLAISRAIDEIAKQQGVTVNTELASLMNGNQSGATSRLSTFSVQTTSGENVEAEIVNTFTDNQTDELYILMCTQ